MCECARSALSTYTHTLRCVSLYSFLCAWTGCVFIDLLNIKICGSPRLFFFFRNSSCSHLSAMLNLSIRRSVMLQRCKRCKAVFSLDMMGTQRWGDRCKGEVGCKCRPSSTNGCADTFILWLYVPTYDITEHNRVI